jgi:hypothetical protein
MRTSAVLLLLLCAPAVGATQSSDTRPRTVPTATPSRQPAQVAQTPAPQPTPARQQPPATTGQQNQPPPPVANPAPSQPQTTDGVPAQSPTTNAPAQSPSTQTTTAAPVAVPSLTPAPFVVLQPAKPIAPNKVREHREEALRALRTRVSPTALPSLTFVTLAALDLEDSRVHLVTLPKETFLRQHSEITLYSTLGAPLRVRILRPNYVNTAVVISDLTGRQFAPLLVQYPIEKFGRFREMAYYTSAHPVLITSDLVKQGQTYVRTMVDLAARRLKDKGQHMTPEVLDMAERLCVVEHIDHTRFMREPRRQLLEEVYALYALNELDTYRYSVSSAGAGGMVQMIAPTYAFLRQRYPSVGLNPDFVAGMRNHGNALEAMLLYIRDTWSDLNLNADIAAARAEGIAGRDELIAAGYNSNPANLARYIRRGGPAWRTLIPRETQMYLQILNAFNAFTPIKPRAEQTPARAASPAATPTP